MSAALLRFHPGKCCARIAGHNVKGATIGHFALGEYFYGPATQATETWMQVQPEEVQVNFSVESLVSRRSFIFARAGFGKSNLNKLLFSSLYAKTPTVKKRHGDARVGTILFDPDGEYFWPDDRGRPGLCDVPHMKDRLVVFTSRRAPSRFYESFVASGIKLDIRRLRPGDVVAIALSQERQEQQNVIKLRSMNQQNWQELVDLVHADGNDASLDRMRTLLRLDPGQEMEALAARANATRIVRMLHDPSSQLMDMIMKALEHGKLCVVDVSQLSGEQALILSGLILRRIFDRNQDEFTERDSRTIPTIAVVEEAQAVLNEKATAAAPYIQWVKEGRKYDLGAVLVTQQPGSIPNEILSQGDNWFLFHLLSAGDLSNVRAANAHFGQDLLSALLNEPIPGQGVFWSSAGGKQYPVPLRVRSFEGLYQAIDPRGDQQPVDTYAAELRRRIGGMANPEAAKPGRIAEKTGTATVDLRAQGSAPSPIDTLRVLERRAIDALRESEHPEMLRSKGMAWGTLRAFFIEKLPEDLDDRGQIAFHLVSKALNDVFGQQGWETYTPEGRTTTWVRVIAEP